MKPVTIKIYLGISLLYIGLLSACSHEEVLPSPQLSNRTVLVYVMGDNNLSSFATQDVNEMIQGAAQTDLVNNNLIVYFDDGKLVELFRLVKDKRGDVAKEIIRTYHVPRNSVGVNELTEIFQLVADLYPATNYGLELWSHGDGWVNRSIPKTRWIGQDENNFLNLSDLNKALDSFPHLDFLFFDACFMSSVEVAYELRRHTDYFIGSPTEIPGPGSNYIYTVPAFFKSASSQDAAIDVAESYYQYYADHYKAGIDMSNDNWTGGVSIAVTRSDRLECLAQTTQAMLSQSETFNMPDIALILDYDLRRYSGHVGYYDLWQVLDQIGGQNTSWQSAFRAAIPYAKSTPMNYSAFAGMFDMRNFNGISVYMPTSTTRSEYEIMEWYQDSGWMAFLHH